MVPIATFHRLAPDALMPMRADRSALGTLPSAAPYSIVKLLHRRLHSAGTHSPLWISTSSSTGGTLFGRTKAQKAGFPFDPNTFRISRSVSIGMRPRT